MSVIDQMIRTFTCNNPACGKTITWNTQEEPKTFQENEWLLGLRVIQTLDNRKFSYCSDLCEIKGAETGQHNIVQKPKVEIPSGSATDAIQKAAQAAAQAEAATAAIKEGKPVTLHTA
jgi:hypothetical protein